MNKKRAAAAVAVILLAAAAFSLYISAHGLTVTHYSLTSPKLTAPIRIVQLTDLHNSVFGEDNKRLTDKVSAQAPDLILITGDLLNRDEERTDIAEGLISALSDIAPVWVSFGNHEAEYVERYGTDIRQIYTDAGAVVVDYEWQDISVNGQTVVIGGIYGYCLPKRVYETEHCYLREYRFLSAFHDTDAYSILMCHMPVAWLCYGSLEDWDFDCVLAGHSHGGQVRFPLIGGLWAPDQGWFPGRMSGVYPSADGTKALVLSRGLGNTDKLPRFNNIPEILVLDLIPGEGG